MNNGQLKLTEVKLLFSKIQYLYCNQLQNFGMLCLCQTDFQRFQKLLTDMGHILRHNHLNDVKAASNGRSFELFGSGQLLVSVLTFFFYYLFYEVANCFLLLLSRSKTLD